MAGHAGKSRGSERFEGFLATSVVVCFLSGMLHRVFEFVLPTYRNFNARQLHRKSSLDRALAVLDVGAQINLWRFPFESTTGTGKDLSGVVFERGLRLSDSHMRLHKADLQRVILADAEFRKMNFRKTVWKGAAIERSLFAECSFQQAQFTPAEVRTTAFEDCEFSRTVVSGRFDRCLFRDCQLDDYRLRRCAFPGTTFRDCSLKGVDLVGVDLAGASFESCDLDGANLTGANLRDASFEHCNLHGAIWSNAEIGGISVTRSEIYGISLWGTKGEPALARELSLTKPGDSASLEIDALHIAVFVASLMEGNGVRELVDGLSSTLVLILGRFTKEHKPVLDEIRSKLRGLGYTAIVFDSSIPRRRDTSETIAVLARLSRFVIADLTEPRSAPYELRSFVTDSDTPLQVVTRGEPPFSMFADLEKLPWVLPAREFTGASDLVDALPELVAGLEGLCGASSSEERIPEQSP
jgi:uncharacterized protein YjbI with pentapeptide repeats